MSSLISNGKRERMTETKFPKPKYHKTKWTACIIHYRPLGMSANLKEVVKYLGYVDWGNSFLPTNKSMHFCQQLTVLGRVLGGGERFHTYPHIKASILSYGVRKREVSGVGYFGSVCKIPLFITSKERHNPKYMFKHLSGAKHFLNGPRECAKI